MQLRMEGEREGEGATPNINPQILRCPVLSVLKYGESLQNSVSER